MTGRCCQGDVYSPHFFALFFFFSFALPRLLHSVYYGFPNSNLNEFGNRFEGFLDEKTVDDVDPMLCSYRMR